MILSQDPALSGSTNTWFSAQRFQSQGQKATSETKARDPKPPRTTWLQGFVPLCALLNRNAFCAVFGRQIWNLVPMIKNLILGLHDFLPFAAWLDLWNQEAESGTKMCGAPVFMTWTAEIWNALSRAWPVVLLDKPPQTHWRWFLAFFSLQCACAACWVGPFHAQVFMKCVVISTDASPLYQLRVSPQWGQQPVTHNSPADSFCSDSHPNNTAIFHFQFFCWKKRQMCLLRKKGMWAKWRPKLIFSPPPRGRCLPHPRHVTLRSVTPAAEQQAEKDLAFVARFRFSLLFHGFVCNRLVSSFARNRQVFFFWNWPAKPTRSHTTKVLRGFVRYIFILHKKFAASKSQKMPN